MSITTAPSDGESIFSYNTTTGAGGSIFEPLLSIIDNDAIDDYANLTEDNNYSNKSLIEKLADNLVHPNKEYLPAQAAVGVGLAVLAHSLNGIAIILKKQSLKHLKDVGSVRASDGGFGYLKLVRWWLGMSVMSVGECLNFIAFMFAPAILVSPLGIVSVLVAAALSPYFLEEKMGMQGRLGCLLAVLGCLIITVCGPKDHEMTSMDEVEYYLTSTRFITYFTIAVIVASTLMYIAPKYGDKNIMIYVLIIGAYGPCAIMFSKSIGLAFMTTIEGDDGLNRWSFWVCFFLLVFCLIIEVTYQQRALDVYNSSILMSVCYVVIGSLIMIFSAIIFSENRNIDWKDAVLTVAGFLVNICALFLLNIDKDPTLKVSKTETDAECPPAISSANSDRDAKESVPEDFCELRRNSKIVDCSTPSCLTPMSTPLKITSIPSCALTSIGSAMFKENYDSNSCLSLISETPSSQRNCNKDETSSDISNHSSADEGINGHSKSLDGESEGESSDVSSSSSGSRRRRHSQEGRSSETVLVRTKLQPDQSLLYQLERSPDKHQERTLSSATCHRVATATNVNKPDNVVKVDQVIGLNEEV